MAENQHRLIKGYRDLSPEEIALMNRIKDFGKLAEELCNVVDHHIMDQRSSANVLMTEDRSETDRLTLAEPEKWARWARDGMQANLMYLTRAVAQPTTF